MRSPLLFILSLCFGLHLSVAAQNADELNWWNDAVFYEIFVRSFYDSDGDGIGDFQGLTQQLDYLNDGDPATTDDLGITGIWLMPINPSPSYHGYDVTDYRGIHPDYGTMEDFKTFLDAAHARGIRVIIDYVMNHASYRHPWFVDSRSSLSSEKRDWFVWEDENPNFTGPWGQKVWHNHSSDYYYGVFWDQMPDLNYHNPEVKAEMFDIGSYWIDEIGVDGFRLDAVKYIFEEGSQTEDLPATHQFFADFSEKIKTNNPNALTVGEAWTSTDKIIPYVTNERIDFCFEFDLAGSIIGAANSGNLSGLGNRITQVLETYPHYQFGTFLTNHDQNRVAGLLGEDVTKMKLAATLYLTLPGVPFLYYGEEVGMTGSKPDENIRRPLPWTNASGAGFTSGTPWNQPPSNYRENNIETLNADPESLLNHYKKLIHARNDYSALRTGEITNLTTTHEAVTSFVRQIGDERVVVAINPTSTNKNFDILFSEHTSPADQLPYDLLSQSVKGTKAANGDLEDFFLGPQQALILVFDRETVLNTQPSAFRVFPNPATDLLQIEMKGKARYALIGMDGKIQASGDFITSKQLDVTSLPSGTYLLQIQQGDHPTRIQKISIQK